MDFRDEIDDLLNDNNNSRESNIIKGEKRVSHENAIAAEKSRSIENDAQYELSSILNKNNKNSSTIMDGMVIKRDSNNRITFEELDDSDYFVEPVEYADGERIENGSLLLSNKPVSVETEYTGDLHNEVNSILKREMDEERMNKSGNNRAVVLESVQEDMDDLDILGIGEANSTPLSSDISRTPKHIGNDILYNENDNEYDDPFFEDDIQPIVKKNNKKEEFDMAKEKISSNENKEPDIINEEVSKIPEDDSIIDINDVVEGEMVNEDTLVGIDEYNNYVESSDPSGDEIVIEPPTDVDDGSNDVSFGDLIELIKNGDIDIKTNISKLFNSLTFTRHSNPLFSILNYKDIIFTKMIQNVETNEYELDMDVLDSEERFCPICGSKLEISGDVTFRELIFGDRTTIDHVVTRYDFNHLPYIQCDSCLKSILDHKTHNHNLYDLITKVGSLVGLSVMNPENIYYPTEKCLMVSIKEKSLYLHISLFELVDLVDSIYLNDSVIDAITKVEKYNGVISMYGTPLSDEWSINDFADVDKLYEILGDNSKIVGTLLKASEYKVLKKNMESIALEYRKAYVDSLVNESATHTLSDDDVDVENVYDTIVDALELPKNALDVERQKCSDELIEKQSKMDVVEQPEVVEFEEVIEEINTLEDSSTDVSEVEVIQSEQYPVDDLRNYEHILDPYIRKILNLRISKSAIDTFIEKNPISPGILTGYISLLSEETLNLTMDQKMFISQKMHIFESRNKKVVHDEVEVKPIEPVESELKTSYTTIYDVDAIESVGTTHKSQNVGYITSENTKEINENMKVQKQKSKLKQLDDQFFNDSYDENEFTGGIDYRRKYTKPENPFDNQESMLHTFKRNSAMSKVLSYMNSNPNHKHRKYELIICESGAYIPMLDFETGIRVLYININEPRYNPGDYNPGYFGYERVPFSFENHRTNFQVVYVYNDSAEFRPEVVAKCLVKIINYNEYVAVDEDGFHKRKVSITDRDDTFYTMTNSDILLFENENSPIPYGRAKNKSLAVIMNYRTSDYRKSDDRRKSDFYDRVNHNNQHNDFKNVVTQMVASIRYMERVSTEESNASVVEKVSYCITQYTEHASCVVEDGLFACVMGIMKEHIKKYGMVGYELTIEFDQASMVSPSVRKYFTQQNNVLAIQPKFVQFASKDPELTASIYNIAKECYAITDNLRRSVSELPERFKCRVDNRILLGTPATFAAFFSDRIEYNRPITNQEQMIKFLEDKGYMVYLEPETLVYDFTDEIMDIIQSAPIYANYSHIDTEALRAHNPEEIYKLNQMIQYAQAVRDGNVDIRPESPNHFTGAGSNVFDLGNIFNGISQLFGGFSNKK